MCEAAFGEFVERAIDLKRRAQPLASQAIEDVVGREWGVGVGEGPEHQLLVAREVVGPDVIMSFVRLAHLSSSYVPLIAAISNAALCANMSRYVAAGPSGGDRASA